MTTATVGTTGTGEQTRTATAPLTVDEVLAAVPCWLCDGDACPHELARLRRAVRAAVELAE